MVLGKLSGMKLNNNLIIFFTSGVFFIFYKSRLTVTIKKDKFMQTYHKLLDRIIDIYWLLKKWRKYNLNKLSWKLPHRGI